MVKSLELKLDVMNVMNPMSFGFDSALSAESCFLRGL